MAISSFWVLVIVLGATLVTIGNIQYNRARETEKKKTRAEQALLLLRPELLANLNLLLLMNTSILKKEITIQDFDTTAWITVSSSELLLGLENEQLSKIIRAYHLTNRANILHDRIMEMSIGVTSSYTGMDKVKEKLFSNLSMLLQELEPMLKTLTDSKSDK